MVLWDVEAADAAVTAATRTRTVAFAELTAREREVLDLLAAGLANDAIATRLYVSDKTVRNAASGCYAKLGVASRAEAIVKAREAGQGG